MSRHVIQQGECLASLADAAGLSWQKVWEHPENLAVRQKRKNPQILFPGDIVFIPDKELRQESRSTDQWHRFRRKGSAVSLRLRLLAAGKPIANEAYVLSIGGMEIQGNTDASGLLEEFVPPSAEDASVALDRGRLQLKLRLGHLDPIAEIAGVQARLNNLGYHCGEVDGVVGPLTRSALAAFQETYQLTVTGEPDPSTQQKLQDKYGC